MIDTLIDRAQQLVNAGRYKEAEKELRHILATDPERPQAHALLAICLSEQNKGDEALSTIQAAIARQPDNDYFLYLQGVFYLRLNKTKDAEQSIRDAIARNPVDANYFGALASIQLQQRNWKDALQAANEGLEKDPDNIHCLNVRSTALHKLDRKDDAYATIREALNQDPENEVTHTNLGWSLLEQGEHKRALEHFREALKLNPNFEYAKAGLVEGLKARYWFYRMFLKYAFWLSNMKAKGQWAVILGLYIGFRVLNGLAATNSELEPFLTPLIYLYIAFAITTWVIEPLSNLMLRLNVYGRYALNEQEIQSSTFVGVALVAALTGGVLFLITWNYSFVIMLLVGALMMIPLSSMLKPRKPLNKAVLIGAAVVMGVIGVAAFLQAWPSGNPGPLLRTFSIGVLIYSFAANFFTTRQ